MFSNLEKTWRDVVLGNKQGPLASFTRGLLTGLSWPYQLATSARNHAYDRGYLPTHAATIPVISVGNIVAGGTGKTPLILKLAEEFSDRPVAILSRGYRSRAEKKTTPTALSMGQGPLYGPEECGDEPYLISSRIPHAIVIVGRDRVQAAQMAVKAGARVILLDDGMQHRRLARDLEIVIVDAGDPFGQNQLLPRGFLRESLRGLQRADVVVCNHVKNEETFELLKKQLLKHTEAPLIGTQLCVSTIQTLDEKLIPNLEGMHVALFSGIGKPEKFRATVEELGAHVVDELIANDHQPISTATLRAFSERSRLESATLLLCTEKDRVKLPKDINTSLPIAWVRVDLNIVYGHDVWQTINARRFSSLSFSS